MTWLDRSTPGEDLHAADLPGGQTLTVSRVRDRYALRCGTRSHRSKCNQCRRV